MPKLVYDKKNLNLNIYVVDEKEFSDKEVLETLKQLPEIQTVSYYVKNNLSKVMCVEDDELMLIKKNSSSKALPNISVFGRIIKKPISIKEARQENGPVTVSGEITSIMDRKLRTEKVLLIFGLYDGTAGINVKYFAEDVETANKILKTIKEGTYVTLRGKLAYDNYDNDYIIKLTKMNVIEKPNQREDNAPRKRVELHLHTNMSEQDGMCSVSEYVERALKWGHPALAITDNGAVQGYIEANELSKEYNYKMIYGLDAYVVDDVTPFFADIPDDYAVDDKYVVFDLETTGFSARNDEIIEIGAVKVEKGKVIDRFSTFVKASKPLPEKIKELTSITDDMLKNAPLIEDVFPKFIEFIDGAPLVAHNADFDMSFINALCYKNGLSVIPSIDTIAMARQLLLGIKRFGLSVVAKHLKVSLQNHHRAVDDAEATAHIFIHLVDLLKEKELHTIGIANAYFKEHLIINRMRAEKTLILLKGQESRVPLYELISESNLSYMSAVPLIPLSHLLEKHQYFLLGSGGLEGRLINAAIMMKPESELKRIASRYDFIEIMPAENFTSIVDEQDGTLNSLDQIREIMSKLYEIGTVLGKIVVATGDVHYLEPEDYLAREIMLYNRKRRGYNHLGELYYRTTEEMLEEFRYLGEDIANEVVVDNSLRIAGMTKPITPVPEEPAPPTLEGAEEELRSICYENARKLYGQPLPEIVEARIARELKSIINNGFASLYLISNKMVKKSMDDGYSVGSRGSVGSSLAAFLGGISDVNPLPPHYYCEQCQYSEFLRDCPFVGVDLPLKDCPDCGTLLQRNGFDIPFEAFLGFKGDKEPDIDLNFAGVYQAKAQKYCEVLFGEGYTFKAGTIGTYAAKTAYGNVKKYDEEHGIIRHDAEVMKYSNKINGVKRSSGQHPAGVLVLPKEFDINYFTPVVLAKIEGGTGYTVATQFDYNMLHGVLLKLDVLGHESPTALRLLKDYTGLDFNDIRLDDPETISIFNSVDALKLKGDLGIDVGALGIPEFGTNFVLGMLADIRPKNVTSLVRISGLSHGTNVWVGNAKEDVASGEVPFEEVIATREDIMNKLIAKGCEAQTAFKIMEKVRKGRGVDENDLAELHAVDMPQWYIGSCQKISYLFPKAHAAAYVMQSIRIAYYKVHYPQAFYAMYFSLKVQDFDAKVICAGERAIKDELGALDGRMDLSQKDKDRHTTLKVAYEMYLRGYEFMDVDLMQSDATTFKIIGDKILPPLQAVKGVAESAAHSIVEARKDGDFLSVEDFQMKSGANKTVIEALEEMGIFEGMSKTNQISFF